jgi:hypothetical protein
MIYVMTTQNRSKKIVEWLAELLTPHLPARGRLREGDDNPANHVCSGPSSTYEKEI